jgi:addiction module HigA family antidote
LIVTIRLEDVGRRILDISNVTSGRPLPPIHPGKILRDEFSIPLGMSTYALANAIKAPHSRANDIVLGRRAITTDTAIRLGRYFGVSPQFWMNLQARYDLDVADRSIRRKIEQEVTPRDAA